jgi:nucleoid-associated protein YgaU
VLAGFFVAIRLLLGPVFAIQADDREPAADTAELAPPSATGLAGALQAVAPPARVIDPTAGPSTSPGIRFVSRTVTPSYVVVAGDNLWSIAQRYNTTAEALQAFNNLDRPALSVGQRLVIP